MDNKYETEIISEENEEIDNRVEDDSIKKEENKKEPFSFKKEIFSWFKIIIVAVVIAFVINNVIIMNANVPTGSMKNTIMEGDHMIGLRTAYWFKDPKRGEIVIFINPDYETKPYEGKYYVKRVIGEPGDKVEIKDNQIYINDSKEPLKEDYLPEEWTNGAGREKNHVFNVPKDCYFLLGDNRNESNDARFWDNTFVNKSDIIAKAEFVYWPWKNRRWLKTADYNK